MKSLQLFIYLALLLPFKFTLYLYDLGISVLVIEERAFTSLPLLHKLLYLELRPFKSLLDHLQLLRAIELILDFQ